MALDGPVEGTEPMLSILAQALEAERSYLQSARSTLTLVSGNRVGSIAGWFYYRFEIPEEILPLNIEHIQFSIGRIEPMTVDANVISIDGQFLTLALPRDLGPLIPEARCAWDAEQAVRPIVETLAAIDPHSSLAAVLFHPEVPENRHAVAFDADASSQTIPEHVEAVRKILQNKVSFVWGARKCGKTKTLALCAAAYVRAGKRILYVAPGNEQVDEMVLRTVELGSQSGAPMDGRVARVDLPSLQFMDALAPFSFDMYLERKRDEKRKLFHERVSLLELYWRVKAQQILHEDYYRTIQEVRSRAIEAKRQAEQLAKEIKHLTDEVEQLEQASILDRLKKRFSKEEETAARQRLHERQHRYKNQLALHQSLTDDAVRRESAAPISAEDMREFRAAVKRMVELGGLEKVTQAVASFIAVDEADLLREKQFVATTVAAVFRDRAVRDQMFDMVLIDEAHAIHLPALAALAGLAREKCVVAGDPFQLQSEAAARSELGREWLRRDIFSHIAGTDELHKLFEWSEQHATFSIFLGVQQSNTPRLSMFASSTLYDGRIQVTPTSTGTGKIIFLDTSDLKSATAQYAGRKRILPYNEQQTKRTIECVKHALMEGGRHATDIGVILPFAGPTLFTKRQFRLHGIENVEVGTPAAFAGRRKRVVVFDTTVAGVDHTMRAIDDKKIGEHFIVRLFSTVLSCVDEDLYVLADMSHFQAVYSDRLVLRFLMLLQAEADKKAPSMGMSVKRFDEMDLERRDSLFTFPPGRSIAVRKEETKEDKELELRMQLLAKRSEGKQELTRDYEREITIASRRVLGLRKDINLLSQFVGGDVLFRGNMASEEVERSLLTRSCRNEREFRDVMEAWNLLVYEMSGGNRTENAVFAQSNPEARVRQDIRRLQTLYSQNVRSIMEEGKKKIAVEVSRVFQELIGKAHLPGDSEEWSIAYIGFLQRLEAYMGWIQEQIRK